MGLWEAEGAGSIRSKEKKKGCACGEQPNEDQQKLHGEPKEKKANQSKGRSSRMKHFSTVKNSTTKEKQPGFLPPESFF